MLVLSRVVGELISIGDDITVRVLSVNGASVRFGVEAPKKVNVHRAEVPLRFQSNRCLGTSCLSINWHCSLSGSKTINAWPLVSA